MGPPVRVAPPINDRLPCSDRAKGETVVYSGIVAMALVADEIILLVQRGTLPWARRRRTA